jgi:TonB family protein
MRQRTIFVFLVALALSAPAFLRAQTQDPTAPIVYKIGDGISPPRAVYQPQPEFSEQARAAHYQGVCTLGMIVENDGTTSHIHVISGLGMGLDEKAIEALRKWRFLPAMKDGAPVRAQIAVELDFQYANHRKIFELTHAANSGDAQAQLDLAHAFLQGKNVGKDERLAETYLERAARQGLCKAQFELAELFAAADPPDYAKAYMWFTLALRAGEKHSNKILKNLTAKMTPEQLQNGQSLLASWTPAMPK